MHIYSVILYIYIQKNKIILLTINTTTNLYIYIYKKKIMNLDIQY